MKHLLTIFLTLLFCCSTTTFANAKKAVELRPDRLQIRFHTGKKEKKNSNETNCTITYTVKFTNRNKSDVTNYTVKIYAYEAALPQNKYAVRHLDTFEETITVPMRKTVELEQKIVNFSYHDHSGCSNHQHGYYGYIMVINNEQGERFLIKSSSSRLLKHTDKILKMDQSQSFDIKKRYVIN